MIASSLLLATQLVVWHSYRADEQKALDACVAAWNQMHACKNVFITDGSAMASSACVNPSLTYMALTARAVDHAVEARRRGEL